jgi:hypothetical protein
MELLAPWRAKNMDTEIYTKADVDRLREVLGDSPGARLLIELEVLRTEVESLRCDAERYRWIVSACEVTYMGCEIQSTGDIDNAMNGANRD